MMKRFVVFLAPVLTAVAMLGAFPAKGAAQHAVPFDGFAEIAFAPDGSLVGEGEGTVLGRFTEVAYPVITGNTFSAKVYLTDVNGDTVNKMATGSIITFGKTTIFSGTFTVNGGTGRFAHATGSGKVIMIVFPDGTIAQAYEGTIRV
jgi:hypothetical protein